MNLADKLSEIETRPLPENMIFLRPHGAVVALSKILERRKIDDTMVTDLLEEIQTSTDEIETLLWTVPRARSYLRKMIVGYLNESSGEGHELVDGFLRHFENQQMTTSLRNTLAIHLSENSAGLASALKIWSKLRRL